MWPLREQRGDEDRTIARAAELVRAGHNNAPPAAARTRVWERLATPERRGRSARLPRFAVAAGLLLFALSIGAAGLAWRHRSRVELAPIAPPAAKPVSKRSLGSPKSKALPIVPPQPEQPAAVPTSPEPTTKRRSAPPTRAPEAPEVTTHAAAPKPTPADDALVFSAMAALRQRHDAAAARAMLADYLRRHPEGALAEEARFLAIEAAPDEIARAAAAGRYLTQFPDGRYRERAARAVAATSP